MNIELIRLKKKLAVMETEGSNQVFMDLIEERENFGHIVSKELVIDTLKKSYQEEIAKLEQKKSKYKQITLL